MAHSPEPSDGISISGGNNHARVIAGRDIINNIVIVGQFLDFARINKLFSGSEDSQRFENIQQAIETSFAKQDQKRLSDGLEGIRTILGPYIERFIPRENRRFDFRNFMNGIPYFLRERLAELHYWDDLATRNSKQPADIAYVETIRLDAASKIWEKEFGEAANFALWFTLYNPFYRKGGQSLNECALYNEENFDRSPSDWNYREFRVFMTGLLVDMMNITAESEHNKLHWEQFQALFEITSKGE